MHYIYVQETYISHYTCPIRARGPISMSITFFFQDGCTALHLATLHGHQNLVTSLVDDGADINAQDGEGK